MNLSEFIVFLLRIEDRNDCVDDFLSFRVEIFVLKCLPGSEKSEVENIKVRQVKRLCDKKYSCTFIIFRCHHLRVILFQICRRVYVF